MSDHRPLEVESVECRGPWKCWNGRDILNMIFSVAVNMYSEKVTSYWYFLICSQRTIEARSDFELLELLLPSLARSACAPRSGMVIPCPVCSCREDFMEGVQISRYSMRKRGCPGV
jgi:hypothetical protein